VSESTPRPSQTTLAAGMVIAGSVLVVVTVGEQLTALNSLETRTAVTDFLASAPGTGLDVPDALALLRVALMVVAGCATAAAILGFHVLRRSRPARLGLTLLAVPLFFGGVATDGFFTSLVALSSMLLWIDPSRAWLERRPVPERPSRPDPTERPGSPWAPPDPTTPPAAAPPPHQGEFGSPVPPPAPAPSTPPVGRRPDALVWGCALTWGFSALTVTLLAASLALLLTDPSVVWTELERQNPDLLAESGLSRDDVLRATYVTLGVGIGWSVLAIALALLAYRGHPAGRVGLVVCAALAALVCLIGSFGAVMLVVPTLACAATVALLSRAEVRAWSARSRP